MGVSEMPGPKLLFLAATHGDEGFTIPILRSFEERWHRWETKREFDWLIANELAFERGVRFVDTDLNRSAPGDPNSTQYEMRRASELLKIAEQYSFVIDLHGTTANSGIFTLMPNPTPQNIALAASLPIKNVVIWAAKSSERFGPLTQFLQCSVEIECGPKTSPEIQYELEQIISYITRDGFPVNPSSREHNWFRVYGRLAGEASAVTPETLQDFQETKLNGESFYPLLVGQYDDAICYKMEPINFWDLLAY